MKFLSVLFLISIFCTAHAQQSSSQWKFPTNVVELCKNLENSIISTYKSEIEANRATINVQLSAAERSDASAISDAAKKFQRINEDSWYKLNCAYLLYKK
jgi:DNA-binding NtrC family response regulator